MGAVMTHVAGVPGPMASVKFWRRRGFLDGIKGAASKTRDQKSWQNQAPEKWRKGVMEVLRRKGQLFIRLIRTRPMANGNLAPRRLTIF